MLALFGIPGTLSGMDQIPAEPCSASWGYTLPERTLLARSGISVTVLDVLEHDCELEAEHDGTHVCSCGSAS